jgi:hypothetical protein
MVGVGGFGEVWKARHAHLRSKPPVALKFCLDAAAVPALRNEAGVLDQVMQHGRHPGIIALLDTHLSADPPCLQYEYVEGGDLAALIRELRAERKLTPDLANRLFVQLVDIVASAHRAKPPIVHDDLKLSNVLVRRREGGGFELLVTDFGIGGVATEQARREVRQPTRSRQELLTEAVRGAYTPLYASPEQMTRKRGEPADVRDDIHALGVLWYQLLTGDLEMLTVPTDWREQVQKCGLKGSLVQLLASCIAPRAETRPPSAVALLEFLGELLPVRAPDPKPSGSPQPRPEQPSGPHSPPAPVESVPTPVAWRILACGWWGGLIALLTPFLFFLFLHRPLGYALHPTVALPLVGLLGALVCAPFALVGDSRRLLSPDPSWRPLVWAGAGLLTGVVILIVTIVVSFGRFQVPPLGVFLIAAASGGSLGGAQGFLRAVPGRTVWRVFVWPVLLFLVVARLLALTEEFGPDSMFTEFTVGFALCSLAGVLVGSVVGAVPWRRQG